MDKRKIEDALDVVSVGIDILMATTLYYEKYESVTPKEELTMNKIVYELLLEALSSVIGALNGE